MNTISEEFLELKEIVNAFNGLEKKYNWLPTDLDWFYPEHYLDYFENVRIAGVGDNVASHYWITGENLAKLANDNEVYFIWGVCSAFDQNLTIDLDEITEEPYANGNPDFWDENPKIQHPQAVVELIFWDSSFILLLSRDSAVSESFRNTFEGWKDLNCYNRS